MSMDNSGYKHNYNSFIEKFTDPMSINRVRITITQGFLKALYKLSPLFCFYFGEEFRKGYPTVQ